MSATKQKSSAGKNVLVFFIVFIIFEMLIIFGISAIFRNKDCSPSIMGYSFFIMDSGNMGTDVPKGTLVIAADGMPTFEDAGKAYLCKNVDGVGTSVFRLSAVVSEQAGKDGVIYKFYQNSDTSKFYDVKSDDIIGLANVHFTGLGKTISFIKSKFGMIVCVAVPLVLLLVLEIIIAFATHKPKAEYEDDDDDFDDDEPKKEVQLDDFLFGGKDEGEQIAKRRKMRESKERREAQENADNDDNDNEDTETEKTSSEKETAVVTASADMEEKTEKSYEEREEEKPQESEEKEETLPDAEEIKQEVPEKTRKATAIDTSGKTASASVEDLMKLMEAEQEKLKKQLNKNQPKQ